MKRNFNSFPLLFLLLFFLISTSKFSARKLAAKQGKVDENVHNMINSKESAVKIGSIYSFDRLMGMDEECQNEYVECSKKRAIVEAHLDYIYTQHHKP